MKTVSANLKTHLAGSTLTLAYLWLCNLSNGAVHAFTDHDQDIVFNGVTYLAATGFTASKIATTAALNVDNLEVQGMLNSATITEADLLTGIWDYAQITLTVVNYNDLTMGAMQLRQGWLGNVKSGRQNFYAELRGMMQPLQQAIGRVYSPGCDATLGDVRCSINLGSYTDTGSVGSLVDARSFTSSGVAGAPGDDYYNSVSLLLHCDGSNNSTVFTDNSSSPKTVTAFGNAKISTTQSKWGGAAAYFDGAGDYLSMPSVGIFPSGTVDFCFEFWVHPTNNATGVYYTVASDGFPFQIYIRNNVAEIYCSSTVTYATYFITALSSPTIAVNTWSHFAFVRYGSNFKVYVNGVGGTPQTSSSAIASDVLATGFFGIFNSTLYPFAGYLDDVRITLGQARYTDNFTTPSSAFYDALPVVGDAATDHYYDGGLLTWLTGANTNYQMEIKSNVGLLRTLQQAMSNTITIGDTYTITAGCDKLLPTCKTKFNNVVNYRGFPNVPGQDAMIKGF